MGLCGAWLSAGPVAWVAVLCAAHGGDLGLETSLLLSVWNKGCAEGSHLDLRVGCGSGEEGWRPAP